MKCKDFGVVILLAAALTACSDAVATSADFSTERMVGILELIETDPRPPAEVGSQRVPLVSPDSVTAGVPFDVIVTTIGLDTCWREAGASVQSELRRVTITPYDRIEGQQSGCGDAIVYLPRTVRVTFTQRGIATLRAEGRRGYGVTANSSALAIERTVYVR